MEMVCTTTLKIEKMSIDEFVERMKELRDKLHEKYDHVDVWSTGAQMTFVYKLNNPED